VDLPHRRTPVMTLMMGLSRHADSFREYSGRSKKRFMDGLRP